MDEKSKLVKPEEESENNNRDEDDQCKGQNKRDKDPQLKEQDKQSKCSSEEKDIVDKLILDKYQTEKKEKNDREKKLLEEGYGGARRKRSRQKQRQWRDSSLTRTPPVKSVFVHPGGDIQPSSEPSIAIRGPNVIGSPPSYTRFDSPKPPPVVKVSKNKL